MTPTKGKDSAEFFAVKFDLVPVGAQVCECADVRYRNNYDGSRDYKLQGKFGCRKCGGAGARRVCGPCDGTGMLRNSTVCTQCGGSGSTGARKAA